MKIKKTKGFSLAEVLISLTIVSVVLAVAVPTITKKNNVGDDSWHWTTGEYQNGAFIDKQKLLLGNNFIPKANFADPSKTDLIEGNYYPSIYSKSSKDYKTIAEENGLISKDSKLTIVKNRIDPGVWKNNAIQNMRDSHVSFYNVGGEGNQSQYAGRLASEQFNLSMGIAALQSVDANVLSLKPDEMSGGKYQYKKDTGKSSVDHFNWNMFGSENTAIGHYALANLIGTNRGQEEKKYSGGNHNVALGYKAMYDNTLGNENTAVGYNALAKTITRDDATSLTKIKEKEKERLDTLAVGETNKIRDNRKGTNLYSQNTVVGNFLGDLNDSYTYSDSSTDMITGAANVMVGNYSELSDSDTRRQFIDYNTFIGHNAGRGLPTYTMNNDGKVKLLDGSMEKTTLPIGTYSDSFNIGTIYQPKFNNILAIGNVNLESTAPDNEKVELIQTTFKEVYVGGDGDKWVEVPRKIVINGDFTIRSLDGTRTIFKVDATNIPIPYSSNDAIFTWYKGDTSGIDGPDRCEGAEFCIGKFNIPSPNTSVFFINSKKMEDAYDMYVRNMAVSVDEGASLFGSLSRIPHLRTALMYLDRYKDTNGTVINFFDKYKILDIFGIDAEWLKPFSAFWGLSDMRLKNIYGDSTIGLIEIDALKIKNYTYKADKTKTPHVGVIAQELKEIFPNSVIEGADGYLSIKQEEMFYGLVKSIQELSAKNDDIKQKIALTYEQIKYTNEQNKLIEQENKLLEKQNKEFAKRIAKLQKNK